MDVVSRFQAINLDGLSQVRLMERTDQKFVVPLRQLASLLLAVAEHYYILEIDGERMLGYQTHYFDTENDQLYRNHHNGKLNRYKVRKRTYLNSRTSFFEIKFKNNKRKTFKRRIETEQDQTTLDVVERAFVRQHSPIDPADLHFKSMNQFSRITLADKQFTERCTIDVNLQFKSQHQATGLDELAIIEIKQNNHARSSILNRHLNESGFQPTGFSKYCIGRALAENDLKQNAFKPKLKRLNKLTNPLCYHPYY